MPLNREVPNDYDRLAPWFDVLRHTNSTIVTGSLQMVTITVFVDRDGVPRMHTSPQRAELFPRRRNVDFRDDN